jgi:hypothetical protein
VLAGSANVAVADPPVTIADVTADPSCVPPLETVNVTVPAFTVPAVLVTVAERVTFWELALNPIEAFAAVVVVGDSGAAVSVIAVEADSAPVVTVTFRLPVVAFEATVMLAVALVKLLTVSEFTVTPEPKLTVVRPW